MNNKELYLIKILIVEDEELYRLELEAFVLELGYELVGSTDNSEEATQLIINEQPDVVIMDININGKLSGIEVAEKLQDVKTSFLFITSLKEKELYPKIKQASYIDYLIKPFDEITLQRAIEIVLNKQINNRILQSELQEWVSDFISEDHVLIKHNSQLFRFSLSDIVYIEAKGKLSIFHTKERSLISNSPFSKLTSALPSKQFIRIHKSFIINIEHINKIILTANEIYLAEQILPIGRVYKESILKQFSIF